jgi:hypothetical protein
LARDHFLLVLPAANLDNPEITPSGASGQKGFKVMRNKVWLLTLLAVPAGGLEARAQLVLGFGPGPIGWSRTGYGVAPWPHHHSRSLVLFGFFGTPWFGPFVPAWAPLASPTAVVVVPWIVQAPAPARPLVNDNMDWQFNGRPIAPPKARAPAAAAPARQPEERRQPERLAAPPPRPKPLEPKNIPAPPARKIQPPGPAPLPPRVERERVENAHQIALGKEAFARGEYGRAERRFQQAAAALPGDPLAHFLLAQARLARGHYPEALAEIQAGLRLRLDWPTVVFRPRDLYGTRSADYTAQLQNLAAALAQYPNDPDLLFLYAYQLWFDDRQWIAALLFGRSRQLAPDPGPSDRFLQVAPVGPMFLW